jgi:hypothetical protein
MAMRQSAEARLDRYQSACCQARIEVATFSDGRHFLICSGRSKVIAVEPKPDDDEDAR